MYTLLCTQRNNIVIQLRLFFKYFLYKYTHTPSVFPAWKIYNKTMKISTKFPFSNFEHFPFIFKKYLFKRVLIIITEQWLSIQTFRSFKRAYPPSIQCDVICPLCYRLWYVTWGQENKREIVKAANRYRAGVHQKRKQRGLSGELERNVCSEIKVMS